MPTGSGGRFGQKFSGLPPLFDESVMARGGQLGRMNWQPNDHVTAGIGR